MSRLFIELEREDYNADYSGADTFTHDGTILYASRIASTAEVYNSTAERKRKQKPTKADYAECKEILEGFCVSVKIPSFDTISELDLFRKKKIAQALINPNITPPKTRKMRLVLA